MITLLVAAAGVWGTWSATQFGAGEDREKESREKRSQIYAEYLNAVRNYAEKSQKVPAAEKYLAEAERNVEMLRKAGAVGKYIAPALAGAQRASEDLTQALRDYGPARLAFEKQVDLVYVYGSDEAWHAHLVLLRSVSGVGFQKKLLTQAGYDSLIDGLDQFQTVFCKEASATPRRECSRPPEVLPYGR